MQFNPIFIQFKTDTMQFNPIVQSNTIKLKPIGMIKTEWRNKEVPQCVFHNIWGHFPPQSNSEIFGIWQMRTQSLTLMTVQNISRLTSVGIFANKDRWVRWDSHRPSLQEQISEISLHQPCIWWPPVNQTSLPYRPCNTGGGIGVFKIISKKSVFYWLIQAS